jgi:aminopeptidase N
LRIREGFLTRLLRIALAVLALAVAGEASAQTTKPVVTDPAAAAYFASSQASADILTVQGVRPPDDVVPIRYDITVTPDAARMTTVGTVLIDVDVKRPVRAISLNAFLMRFGPVTLDARLPARISQDAEAQTATFSFSQDISPGRHQLSIAFTSGIAPIPYGLFALDYRNPEGGTERLLATQFESTAAHRFIPCWDNPSTKAVFVLHVVAPADRMAVSNMPVQHTALLAAGLQRVDFAATPKMSPYLLFLSIGDYRRIHRTVDGVDVGVVLLRGQEGQGGYALDTAADILHYYNSYFGVRYPLPKMDMIGAPVDGGEFSAMENWGALFYLEQALEVAPGGNDARRQFIFNVMAHEMAHQWFGDLVTMRDWNELWLNEGFANWMAVKAADALHPGWRAWTQDLPTREAAMDLDARSSAPPIITRPDVVTTTPPSEAILYDKGEYVVRMLEAYLGEDAFRDGVRRYMRDNQYGNTTSDTLWAALKTASGVDIAAMAHSFTDQPGIPLITAQTTPGGLHVVQSRFGLDDGARAPETWLAPLAVAPSSLAGSREPLISAASPLDLKLAPGAATLLNAGQKSYLRIDYDPASFAALRQTFASLPAIDQLGILDDQWALAGAGYRPISQYLSLLRQIPADDSPLVWSRVIGKLASLDALYADGAQRVAYHATVAAFLAPVKSRPDLQAASGETAEVGLLRAELIMLASRFAKAQPEPLARPHDRDERLAMIDGWAGGG